MRRSIFHFLAFVDTQIGGIMKNSWTIAPSRTAKPSVRLYRLWESGEKSVYVIIKAKGWLAMLQLRIYYSQAMENHTRGGILQVL